jgi:hypothetical protein
MANDPQTLDRCHAVREAVEAALAANVRERQASVVELVERFLEVAREARHLRVGCRADGAGLTLSVAGGEPMEVVLPRARGILRTMCARLAVLGVERGVGEITTYLREGRREVERGPDLLPPLYGGRCFIRAGEAPLPGWAVELMNTTDHQWFDLTWCEACPSARPLEK